MSEEDAPLWIPRTGAHTNSCELEEIVLHHEL